MKKLIVFDLDGTLIDSLPDIHKALNHALTKHRQPSVSLAETRDFIGEGSRRLIEKAAQDKALVDVVLRDYMDYYGEHLVDLTQPFPGILELLQNLQGKCYLCILSNKFQAAVDRIVQEFFPGLFDWAMGESQQIRRKPDPGGLQLLLQKFQCNREDALIIGDGVNDLKLAQNAGLQMITVGWGYDDFQGIADPEALLEVLLEFIDETTS